MEKIITGRATTLTFANAPNQRMLYRARQAITEEDQKYYNDYWGRMEVYLNDLKLLNPSCTVILEKSSNNRFLRYFVGLGASIHALQHCGIDFYGRQAHVTTITESCIQQAIDQFDLDNL